MFVHRTMILPLNSLLPFLPYKSPFEKEKVPSLAPSNLPSSKMEQPPNSTKEFKPSSSKPPKAKKISISILVISLPLLYVSLLHIPPSTLFKDTTFWFLMSNSIIIIVAADSGVFSSSSDAAGDLYDEFIRHSRAKSARLVAEPPPMASIADSPRELMPAPTRLDATVDNHMVVKESSVPQLEKPVKRGAAAKERSLPQPGVEVDTSIVVYEKPPRRSATEKKDHHRLPLRRRSVAGKSDHRRLVGCQHSNLPLRRSVAEEGGDRHLEDNEYSKLSDEELNERVEEFIRRFNREIRLQLRNE